MLSSKDNTKNTKDKNTKTIPSGRTRYIMKDSKPDMKKYLYRYVSKAIIIVHKVKRNIPINIPVVSIDADSCAE
jgi:hypothetical protein